MSEGSVYLDNASTTAVDPLVLEAMLPFLRERFGNASSAHRSGQEARAAVEQAREHVASLFDAEPGEIVFTSGGTEADTWAISSAFASRSDPARTRILTSFAEHQAVLKTCERLGMHGAAPVFLPVDRTGAVRMDLLEAGMGEDVALVSLMHVNNETGALTDVARCASTAHRYGALFHTDTVQSAGKSGLSARTMDFDLASASGHKIHGPKGVGALYIRNGLRIEPLLHGGAQERGRRGGTENVSGIVGFGEAARLAVHHREECGRRWTALRDALIDRLHESFPGIVINGSGAACQANIVSISFPYAEFRIDGQALPLRLDLEGVAVSSGSACTAGSIEPSHVMRAIGHDEETSRASLRFSFGRYTTADDVERGVEALIRAVYGAAAPEADASHSRRAIP